MRQIPNIRQFWRRWWERSTGKRRYQVIVHPQYSLVVRARTPHEAAVLALLAAFAQYGRRSPMRLDGYEVLPTLRVLRVSPIDAPDEETLWPVADIAAELGYGRPFSFG